MGLSGKSHSDSSLSTFSLDKLHQYWGGLLVGHICLGCGQILVLPIERGNNQLFTLRIHWSHAQEKVRQTYEKKTKQIETQCASVAEVEPQVDQPRLLASQQQHWPSPQLHVGSEAMISGMLRIEHIAKHCHALPCVR